MATGGLSKRLHRRWCNRRVQADCLPLLGFEDGDVCWNTIRKRPGARRQGERGFSRAARHNPARPFDCRDLPCGKAVETIGCEGESSSVQGCWSIRSAGSAIAISGEWTP